MPKISTKELLKTLQKRSDAYYKLVKVDGMPLNMLYFSKEGRMIHPELLYIDKDNSICVDYTSLKLTNEVEYEGDKGILIEWMVGFSTLVPAEIKAFDIPCFAICHYYKVKDKLNIKPIFLIWNKELERKSNITSLFHQWIY